jgi:MFS transporter, DHA2 family, multidrug resistance protein
MSASSSTSALKSPGAPVASTAEDTTYRYRWFILIGLMTAAVMEVLDTTIINVALPQMAGNLGATTQEIAWISTGYILSNVVVLPMTAFLTETFGRRKYLLASIFIFILSSFLCGISSTLGELILWRIIQGAAGAALLSTAQATIRQIFPTEQQGMVQSIFLLGIIVAPTLGPTLGGYITDNYTWNWCFLINVPIGIVSMILVASFLFDPPGQGRRSGSIDFIGIGLLAVGLASLQYVLEEGNQDEWFESPTIVRLSILAAICLTAMFVWELHPKNKNPVVDFRVLKNRTLAASLVLFVSLGFGLYGGVYLFPLFAQQLLGFTPTTTGLALMPGGLATACTSLICGRIMNGPKPLVDPRVLIYIGVSVFAYAMWDLGHLTTAAGEPDTRIALIIRGAALGFLFTPINSVAYASIHPSQAQQTAGLINLARQLGGSFGIAILGTYLTNHTQMHRADLVNHVYTGNPAYQNLLSNLTANLIAKGYDAAAAQQAAMAQIGNMVQRQASILAYNDSWLLILLAFVLASPTILLLQRPKRGAAPPPDAH